MAATLNVFHLWLIFLIVEWWTPNCLMTFSIWVDNSCLCRIIANVFSNTTAEIICHFNWFFVPPQLDPLKKSKFTQESVSNYRGPSGLSLETHWKKLVYTNMPTFRGDVEKLCFYWGSFCSILFLSPGAFVSSFRKQSYSQMTLTSRFVYLDLLKHHFHLFWSYNYHVYIYFI